VWRSSVFAFSVTNLVSEWLQYCSLRTFLSIDRFFFFYNVRQILYVGGVEGKCQWMDTAVMIYFILFIFFNFCQRGFPKRPRMFHPPLVRFAVQCNLTVARHCSDRVPTSYGGVLFEKMSARTHDDI